MCVCVCHLECVSLQGKIRAENAKLHFFVPLSEFDVVELPLLISTDRDGTLSHQCNRISCPFYRAY